MRREFQHLSRRNGPVARGRAKLASRRETTAEPCPTRVRHRSKKEPIAVRRQEARDSAEGVVDTTAIRIDRIPHSGNDDAISIKLFSPHRRCGNGGGVVPDPQAEVSGRKAGGGKEGAARQPRWPNRCASVGKAGRETVPVPRRWARETSRTGGEGDIRRASVRD